jgi:hypothetical protein
MYEYYPLQYNAKCKLLRVRSITDDNLQFNSSVIEILFNLGFTAVVGFIPNHYSSTSTHCIGRTESWIPTSYNDNNMSTRVQSVRLYTLG